MKVMNEIKAEVKGVIAEVVAENGKPVQLARPCSRFVRPRLVSFRAERSEVEESRGSYTKACTASAFECACCLRVMVSGLFRVCRSLHGRFGIPRLRLG
jgi:hypothetical protein